MTPFVWRDKGLELIIKALKRKTEGSSYEEFFKSFDFDHDGYLTPKEFRMAMLSLKEKMLNK